MCRLVHNFSVQFNWTQILADFVTASDLLGQEIRFVSLCSCTLISRIVCAHKAHEEWLFCSHHFGKRNAGSTVPAKQNNNSRISKVNLIFVQVHLVLYDLKWSKCVLHNLHIFIYEASWQTFDAAWNRTRVHCFVCRFSSPEDFTVESVYDSVNLILYLPYVS